MTSPVQTDSLSLTLPKARSRSRARRRSRLPKGWWWLMWALVNVGTAVWNLTDGHWLTGSGCAAAAAFYWRLGVRSRPSGGPFTSREWMVLLGVVTWLFAAALTPW